MACNDGELNHLLVANTLKQPRHGSCCAVCVLASASACLSNLRWESTSTCISRERVSHPVVNVCFDIAEFGRGIGRDVDSGGGNCMEYCLPFR